MFHLNMAQGLLQLNSLYITPDQVSIVAMSISGIVIAVGTTAVILWRKAKKKAALILKIDENANKEVEEELVIKDGEASEESAAVESK